MHVAGILFSAIAEAALFYHIGKTPLTLSSFSSCSWRFCFVEGMAALSADVPPPSALPSQQPPRKVSSKSHFCCGGLLLLLATCTSFCEGRWW